MKFDFKKLKFEYDGKKHELRYPTTGEIEDFSSTSEDSEKPMEPTYKLLERLGLPREDARNMVHEHLMQVVSELASPKKS